MRQDACFYQTTPQPPTQGKSEGMQSKPQQGYLRSQVHHLKHIVSVYALCVLMKEILVQSHMNMTMVHIY